MAIAEGVLFEFELLFETDEGAVLELGGLVEVVGAFGAFDLLLRLFELFAEAAQLVDAAFFGLPLRAEFVLLAFQFGEFFFEFFETVARGLVAFLAQGFAFDFELHAPARDFVELGGQGIDFGAELGGGFVDKVDGLVGEEAVGDVAIREDRGGHQGRIFNADAVMDLVALAETAEDRDGVFDAGLVDEHGLEAALEGGVLFDVLAELIERGGADAVQFAAGEHGLEQVAGVHGAIGFAGADDGV